MTSLYITSILTIFVITFVLYKYFRFRPYGQKPLDIKTFDGSDSPYHPSVIYFSDGWNGYKYWMAETPFSPKCKPYVDRNECPSIHASNDGIHWCEPDGLKNPIVNFGIEGERNLDYYSDPHLVYNGIELECWYRLTERHGNINDRHRVSLRRVKSRDGITWSDEEIISQLDKNKPDEGLGQMVVSQALLYENGCYKIWFVDSESHCSQRQVVYCESSDCKSWNKRKICKLNVGESINPWHIDVEKIDDKYILTVYDYDNISLWESADGINFDYITTALKPSKVIGSFYSHDLYRSCLIKTKDEYKLYFSADDRLSTSIGLLRGKGLNTLCIDNSTGNYSILRVITSYTSYFLTTSAFIIKQYSKRLRNNVRK